MRLTRREWLALAASAAGAAPFRGLGALSTLGRRAPTERAEIEIALTATPATVPILPGTPTEVWRFTGEVLRGAPSVLQNIPGSYLGPTIRVRRGDHLRIRFRNELPDPSIVHWHGLDVPESADGHPRFAVPKGEEYTYEFEVRNRAGTYWYHPHPHMQTGPQVYSGLAGLLLVGDDEEDSYALPTGADDLVCVLQDRRFGSGNQLVYSTTMMDMETGFLGDRILVNGVADAEWSLATRAYRLRVLNGSNARIYKLSWSDGSPVTVLGSDGGLLAAPEQRPYLTLAPAQRADIWLDLSRRAVGSTLALRSAEFTLSDAGLDMMAGRGMGVGRMGGGGRGAAMGGETLRLGAAATLLRITVDRRESGGRPLPPSFAPHAAIPTAATPVVREIPLTFRMMQWELGGRTFEMQGVAPDEVLQRNSIVAWEFVNAGGPMGMQMAHPMHIHGPQFRVVRRSGGDPSNSLRDGVLDDGWTDTVLVLPNERVRVHIPVTGFPGLYLYHCHILEHEDMGMMRNFRVV